MKLEGSCHCGGVRFLLESRHPYPFNHCYCSICRKTAGGGYAINLGGEADSLSVTGEENLRIYQARGEDGEISEELSTKAALSLSKQTLQGSVPKKSALKNKQFYSLVCLDAGALTKAIDQMKVLGEAQRRALARRAAAAHKELDEQMEKY